MLLAILPLVVVAAPQTEVKLYDANHEETFLVHIGLDGTVDDATQDTLEHAFRCRRSGKEHVIDRGLLSLIARVQQHWPGKTIEYVSAYRGHRGQRHDSRHWQGRAFDFRVQGVKLTEVRDWIWSNCTECGVGWYPTQDFLHMDHRAGFPDIAWTQKRPGASNRYHPSWASRVREKRAVRARESRVGG